MSGPGSEFECIGGWRFVCHVLFYLILLLAFLFWFPCALLFIFGLTLPFLLPGYWFIYTTCPLSLPSSLLSYLCALSCAGLFCFSTCNWCSLWIFCPFSSLVFCVFPYLVPFVSQAYRLFFWVVFAQFLYFLLFPLTFRKKKKIFFTVQLKEKNTTWMAWG